MHHFTFPFLVTLQTWSWIKRKALSHVNCISLQFFLLKFTSLDLKCMSSSELPFKSKSQLKHLRLCIIDLLCNSYLYNKQWMVGRNHIVTTPTKPQHSLNLTQLSWVWHDNDFTHPPPTPHPKSTSIKISLRVIVKLGLKW